MKRQRGTELLRERERETDRQRDGGGMRGEGVGGERKREDSHTTDRQE